ncbi:hypothetical protein [Rhodococcoides fascians]|uniref:hypothetical protein n=1 Tax=Rhodococcoides fascians TaxID=1828 RepID=UPI00050C9052|nr:hypothetical protein [Rhodococcus fascians]
MLPGEKVIWRGEEWKLSNADDPARLVLVRQMFDAGGGWSVRAVPAAEVSAPPSEAELDGVLF